MNNLILDDQYSVIRSLLEYDDNFYVHYYNIITDKEYINKIISLDNYPIISNNNLAIIEDDELFEILKEKFKSN